MTKTHQAVERAAEAIARDIKAIYINSGASEIQANLLEEHALISIIQRIEHHTRYSEVVEALTNLLLHGSTFKINHLTREESFVIDDLSVVQEACNLLATIHRTGRGRP